MTEETQLKEVVQEPAPQSISKTVGIMVEALALSKDAARYEDETPERQALIFFGGGSQATKNPTLYRFIKIAEKVVIKEIQKAIIEKAGELIETELDKIRGLLG